MLTLPAGGAVPGARRLTRHDPGSPGSLQGSGNVP